MNVGRISLLALLLQLSQYAAAFSTIPCPGLDDPSNFSSVPLDQRPNLQLILQHGFSPVANLATLPSLEAPGNPTQVHQGFVNRPFRQFNQSFCRYENFPPIRCARSARADITFWRLGNFDSLVSEQSMLESASWGMVYPLSNEFYNPSYREWETLVKDFLHDEDSYDCEDEGRELPALTLTALTSHSCDVTPECGRYHPEFVADIAALPVNTTTLEPYQAFVEKWGYGSVEGFYLGAVDLVLTTIPRSGDSPASLYMGRAGGLGKNISSEGDHYTEDDCADPAPVWLKYKKWYEVLRDGAQLEEEGISHLEEIRWQFLQLHLTYESLYAQVRRQNFTDFHPEDCPKPIPTMIPSGSPIPPADEPTSKPMVTAGPTSVPTTDSPTRLLRSVSPTETPTNSSIDRSTAGPTLLTEPTAAPTRLLRSVSPTEEPTDGSVNGSPDGPTSHEGNTSSPLVTAAPTFRPTTATAPTRLPRSISPTEVPAAGGGNGSTDGPTTIAPSSVASSNEPTTIIDGSGGSQSSTTLYFSTVFTLAAVVFL